MESLSFSALSDILDILTDGVILFQNNAAVYANAAALRIVGKSPLGRSPASLLGQMPLDIVGHDLHQAEFSFLVREQWVYAQTLRTDGLLVLRLRTDENVHFQVAPSPYDTQAFSAEIRKLLSVLVMSAELLSNDAHRNEAAAMLHACHKLTKLFHQFSVFSYPEVAPDGHAYMFDLNTLFRHLMERLSGYLSHLSMQFTVKQAQKPITAYARSSHIEQLVLNYIAAVDYLFALDPQRKEGKAIHCSFGETATRFFISFSANALSFPVSLLQMRDYVAEYDTRLPLMFCINTESIFQILRLYRGTISVLPENESRHKITFSFPRQQQDERCVQDADALEQPLSPLVELSDVLPQDLYRF